MNNIILFDNLTKKKFGYNKECTEYVCKNIEFVSIKYSDNRFDSCNYTNNISVSINTKTNSVYINNTIIDIHNSTIIIKYTKDNIIEIYIAINLIIDEYILNHSWCYDDDYDPDYIVYDICHRDKKENSLFSLIKYIINGVEIELEDFSYDYNEDSVSLKLLIDNGKYTDKTRFIILANSENINNTIEYFNKQIGYMKIKLKDDDILKINIIKNQLIIEISSK